MNLDFYTIILGIPIFLLSLSIHEFAHGKVADLLGDPTPRFMGRLTLDPRAHLDPWGLLTLLITQRIGWAKPVIVNPQNFKDARKGMLLVGLAGPVANLILAGLAAISIHLWRYLDPEILGKHYFQQLDSIPYSLLTFLIMLLFTNIGLALFNLLPFPPLDGSKVLAGIVSPRYLRFLSYLEGPAGMVIILLLAMTGLLGKIIEPAIIFVVRLMGL